MKSATWTAKMFKYKFKYRLSIFYGLMRFYGFGELDPNKTQPEGKLYNVFSWSLFGIMLIEACSILSGTILEKDQDMKIFGMAINCTHFLFTIKYWSFLRNRDKLKHILNLIEKKCYEFTQEIKFGDMATTDMYAVVRNYGIMANVSILGYVFVTINRGKSDSEAAEKGWQIVPMYIPFDFQFSQDGVYIIQSLMNVFILLNGYYHVVLDIMMSAVFIHVGAQFASVAHCFSTVNFKEHTSKPENEVTVYKEMVKAIGYHQAVLRCAKLLQDALKYWFLAQIIESSLPLCLTLWLIITSVSSESSSVLNLIPPLMFMSFLLYQLYILTRGADIITHQARGVVDGVSLSDWYLLSSRNRKNLVHVLLRANKPVKFTALGIVGVNINTFIEVVKNAYAFFTLLKNSNVAAHK